MPKFFNTEEELVDIYVRYLRNRGCKVLTEIPFYEGCVDIVAKKDGNITMIEAKLRDWKRVLIQCRSHGAGADYVSILMGSVNISSNLLSIAREKGFGLIHCSPNDGKIRLILEPIKNKVWGPAREHFESTWNYIREGRRESRRNELKR